ncbi:hypothetical protein NPIL_650361 [Nephila pilipes]|uniref:Uncharacterized protein n=1 Tax=Nephila pilipes TaxID=299642 RepID=A0A8X6QZC5_NEPPI|nr:hypothetical protein NPIL_650361 [Nephila pilipes]
MNKRGSVAFKENLLMWMKKEHYLDVGKIVVSAELSRKLNAYECIKSSSTSEQKKVTKPRNVPTHKGFGFVKKYTNSTKTGPIKDEKLYFKCYRCVKSGVIKVKCPVCSPDEILGIYHSSSLTPRHGPLQSSSPPYQSTVPTQEQSPVSWMEKERMRRMAGTGTASGNGSIRSSPEEEDSIPFSSASRSYPILDSGQR